MLPPVHTHVMLNYRDHTILRKLKQAKLGVKIELKSSIGEPQYATIEPNKLLSGAKWPSYDVTTDTTDIIRLFK